MKKMTLLLLFLFYGALLPGYLPHNWSEHHAADDIAKADAIVIGRVIGIEMAGEHILQEKTPKGERAESRIRIYQARYRVGEVLKGNIEKDLIINIPMGGDFADDESDLHDLRPAWPMLIMHNTQQAYDIRINQVYLMYLTKVKNGWDLRSGPLSLGWIKPENKIAFGELSQKWQKDQKADDYLRNVRNQLKGEK